MLSYEYRHNRSGSGFCCIVFVCRSFIIISCLIFILARQRFLISILPANHTGARHPQRCNTPALYNRQARFLNPVTRVGRESSNQEGHQPLLDLFSRATASESCIAWPMVAPDARAGINQLTKLRFRDRRRRRCCASHDSCTILISEAGSKPLRLGALRNTSYVLPSSHAALPTSVCRYFISDRASWRFGSEPSCDHLLSTQSAK